MATKEKRPPKPPPLTEAQRTAARQQQEEKDTSSTVDLREAITNARGWLDTAEELLDEAE